MKILLISTNTLTQPYATYPIGLDYIINAVSARHKVKSVDMNELRDGQALAAVVDAFRPDVTGVSIRNIDNIDHDNTGTFVDTISGFIDIVRSHSTGVIVSRRKRFHNSSRRIHGKTGCRFRHYRRRRAFSCAAPSPGAKESCLRSARHRDPNGFGGFSGALSAPFGRGDLSSRSVPFLLPEEGGNAESADKRGCPFKCVYCTYPQIEGSSFRFAEPGEVARTARMLQDAGAKSLYITDSTFNGSYDHSLKVARAFAKFGISIPWGGFFTPTPAPPDYYRELKDTGLKHVEFGTESLSDSVLEAYGKPFRAEDVFASHRSASGAGIHIAHYLMPGGPGEDDSSLSETILSSSRLENAVFFVFGGVRIYPRTKMYETALREKQIHPERTFWSLHFTGHRSWTAKRP